MSSIANAIRRLADWWEAAAERWHGRRYRVHTPFTPLGERAADVRDKTVEAAKRVGGIVKDQSLEALGESKPVSVPWVALVVIGVGVFGAGFGIARLTEGDSMSEADRALLNQIAGYSPKDRIQQATYVPDPLKPVDLSQRPVVSKPEPAPVITPKPRKTELLRPPD